jgi:hypothetical protein
MRLLRTLLEEINQRARPDWVVQEFHVVVATYGRTRQVQPQTPEPRYRSTAPVPEKPLRFHSF